MRSAIRLGVFVLIASLSSEATLSQDVQSVVGDAPPGLALSELTGEGVWELRIYTINRDRLDDFVEAWRDGVYPLRLQFGFQIPAAWVNREDNQFIWVLGYNGPLEWEEAQAAYYGSDERQSLDNDPVPFIARTENLSITAVRSPARSDFTHAHFRVPDGRLMEAAQWRQRVLGGVLGQGGAGPGVSFPSGRLPTMPNEGMATDAATSVIDHIGIGVTDVRATVERARELGAEIRTEPREGITARLIAQITDPWGGRFELLQDDDYPGVNHIHLVASDADAMRDWLLQVFGGERDDARGQGRFHAILYDDVWFLISEAAEDDQRMPSRYHALDHIGFMVPSLDAFIQTLSVSGYEPYLKRPNPPRADLVFFEGPDGLHVEVTEPPP